MRSVHASSGVAAMSASKSARIVAAMAQKRSTRGEGGPSRLRVGPNGSLPIWRIAKAVGPRLEDGEVVELVAVQDLVDPAPRGVAPDRLDRQLPGDRPARSWARSPRARSVAGDRSAKRARRRSLRASKSPPS